MCCLLLGVVIMISCGVTQPGDSQTDDVDFFLQQLPDFRAMSYHAPSESISAHFRHNGKELWYLAVMHTNQIDGSVAQAIENILDEQKPALCILEGWESWEGVNPQRIITMSQESYATGICSESLTAAYLCHKKGIAFVGGEVDDVVLLQMLKRRGFAEQDVIFFMLAQQIPFWHRDHLFDKENPKQQFDEFLQNTLAGWMRIPITQTYEDFQRWHEEHRGKSYDPDTDFLWKTAATNEYELRPSLHEGATIYQKLAAHIYNIRDAHILCMIKQALQSHDKVLVVFGAAHYLWQKQALIRLLGIPRERDMVGCQK